MTDGFTLMNVMVELNGADSLVSALKQHGKGVSRAVGRGMKRISNAVAKKAQDFAPRSPTRTIASKTLKVQRRSKSQRTPGGLEKSIRPEVRIVGADVDAVVFVASTAPAGKYAKRIHDEKGKTWHKRGPGTVAKGPQADDKFIERAVKETQKNFGFILEFEIAKELGKK